MKKYLKKLFIIPLFFVGILFFSGKVSAATYESEWDSNGYHYSCPAGSGRLAGDSSNICYSYVGQPSKTDCSAYPGYEYTSIRRSCIKKIAVATQSNRTCPDKGYTSNYEPSTGRCYYNVSKAFGRNKVEKEMDRCRKIGGTFVTSVYTKNASSSCYITVGTPGYYCQTGTYYNSNGYWCVDEKEAGYVCSSGSLKTVGGQSGCFSTVNPTARKIETNTPNTPNTPNKTNKATSACKEACSSSQKYYNAVSSCRSSCEASCQNAESVSSCVAKFKRSSSDTSLEDGNRESSNSDYNGGGGGGANTPAAESKKLITEIELSKTSVVLGKGQSIKISATIKPSDATDPSLKWESSDKSIATINDSGEIKAKKKGSVRITVTANDGSGVKATCAVKVTDKIKITKISITSKMSVKTGRKKQIKLTVEPSNASNKDFKWESSDNSIATVDSKGVVKGIKKGTVTITATTKDGNKIKDECEVTVDKMEQLKFKKGSTSVRFNKIGEKKTLEYNSEKGEKVVFESTDPSIATVSNKGVVTAKKIGKTTIIAYYKGDKASQIESKIYVGALVESISSKKTSYSIKPGESFQLEINIKPKDAAVPKIRYVSTDSSIAKVSSSGVVTGVSKGTTTIIMNTRDGSRKTANVIIIVSEDGTGKADASSLKNIKECTLSKKILKTDIGKTEKITIEKNPSKIPKDKLEWFSRNEKIAKVSKKGVITGVSSGQTAIYLLYNAGNGVKKTVGIVRVDVNYIKLKTITIKPSSKTLKPGETVKLSVASYTPKNAVNTNVSWSSSNTNVANVNPNGEVVAIKNGTATIYAVAKDGSRTTGKSKIVVSSTGKPSGKPSKNGNNQETPSGKKIKATSIKLSQSTVSIGAGQTTKLTVSFAPGNVTNKKLKWKSSNTSIATVDQDGIVKGLKKGKVTITASTTDGSKKSTTCTVNVVKKVLLTSISIDNKISLKAGKKKTLKVLYTPNNASKKSVKWTSSNTSVAVVSTKGVVKAKSAGKAVITATARDGSKKTATCIVTVKGKSTSSGSVNDKEYNKKHQDEEIIQKRIFIGDSRTEGMHNAVGSKSSDVWSAKTGEGYDWMVSTGVPAVESQIGKATAVIILMGVNDYAYNAMAESYSKYINEKAAVWVKKGAKVYFVSVNAVDDAKSQYAKNHSINAFNVKVKSLLSKNVTYIDTYNNINWNAVKFDDSGVHYDAATYKTIYNYILNKIYKVSNTKNGKKNKTKTIKVTNVSISGSNAVQVGKSIKLNAKVTPSNASNKSVTWASNNKKIATVSAAGTVRGLKAGTVTITATAKDGSKKKATYKVTISKKVVKNNSDSQNIQKPQSKKVEENIEDKPINVNGFYTDVGVNKTANYTTIYNDYWFSNKMSSSKKNNDLAALSMFASASVYNLPSAVSLLQKCGFQAEQVSVPNSETNNDHVSFVIGHKKIGDISLVAIIIKGTSGDYEWVSNFNVGKSTTHEGFKIAKDELANTVKVYLTRNQITGKVKYWVTGHSRGAAVANLYANNLNKSVGSENVYAYTFATPRVSKSATSSSNIFNYINSGDFVTEVAPSKWGFRRFGNDIVISSGELKAMKSSFNSITGIEYGGFTEKKKNELLEKFLVYSGNSQEEYYKVKHYKARTIVVKKYPEADFSAAEFCQKGVGYAIAGNSAGKERVENWGAVAIKASDFATYVVGREGLKTEFAHAHCVSTYVSWLTSLTSNSTVKGN